MDQRVKLKQSVGLIADTMDILHQLRLMLDSVHVPIACAFRAESYVSPLADTADLWLVVSEDAADIFDKLSDETESPIFLSDTVPDITDKLHYEQWRQSMLDKVLETLQASAPEVTAEQSSSVGIDFRDVWVIAASLGGPEAVKEFLAYVSPDLPVAFVYGQHIEANFAERLPDILNKHSSIETWYAENGRVLRRGALAVFPSHQLTSVDENGQLNVAQTVSWQAPYTPNLNQMVQNIARHFEHRMGVIVFSGMCDDGASASVQLARKGMPLWAQEPEACVCASMPEAVIESGFVGVTGTPVALAEALNTRYGCVFQPEESNEE
ncbi:Chemotaxis response regulator protein-glutamate methylesterase of group 1 operon [BD1-7 clade bacterium]|uniref:protein-glutamate methylesterase n=1 Tax=BD1-7 clade bacterium TaxID=2029982 RepID=A0A5S9QBV7_9GAMM|nr:Chemotaxis response regulator protein-glutamate methylesterase of group 1 operon [BD1-7 clade bacterium]